MSIVSCYTHVWEQQYHLKSKIDHSNNDFGLYLALENTKENLFYYILLFYEKY